MLKPRWTYSNPNGLTKWYGHVDYYGQYIIGQWFALDAHTGKECWSKNFLRPTTIRGCSRDIIVATETRSDGPWTLDFGIYGISAQTGTLLWCNHGSSLWGKLLRYFDYIPAFTNGLRDSPKCIVDLYVVTERGRVLDLLTGLDSPVSGIRCPTVSDRSSPEHILYDHKSLPLDGHLITVEGRDHEFSVVRRDMGRCVWRYCVKQHLQYVNGNYYSYRYHRGFIFLVAGDAPNHVPIDKGKPNYVKPNPANFQMGVLNLASGKCEWHSLSNAQQIKVCRIEAIRDSRLLISCDGTQLTEYEISI